ncbi:MAG TPA: PD-(D/E)XK nuclease family protein [Thermoplasmata archaeon]|nr:PD-(D/E)XK nuclease family protein [Thermoplasmata archaeon]
MGSVPTLSYSSVRTYLECPLRWRYLYLERLPEAPRGYFSFGKTVHSVLEELLRPYLRPTARRTEAGTQRTLEDFGAGPAPAPPPLGTEEMLALYDRLWIPDGYDSPEDEARYRELGRTLLRRYYGQIIESPPTPVAIEPHLETTWDGVPIHGYIDRIDLTESGGLEVLDYKTGRGLSLQDALTSDQLAIYQVLVERNFPHPVERLSLIDLRGGARLATPPRTARHLTQLRESVGSVADGIRDEEFAPTPGRACVRCEFRDRCPEFREVPVEERAHLAQLVDRFAELRQAERGLERELAATAGLLHAEAERIGIHRIPGANEVAVRRRERRGERLPPVSDGAAEGKAPGSSPLGRGRWYWALEPAPRGPGPKRGTTTPTEPASSDGPAA